MYPARWVVERSNAWVERCKSLVKNFERSLENVLLFNDSKSVLYEAKLLIVGEDGAGKTTLARKIQDVAYELPAVDIDSTEGIDVIKWQFPYNHEYTYRVNIWDFGGQEIYHAMHQFFLT